MSVAIGIIVSLAVFISGIIWAGGSLLMFWDFPSIVIVLGFDIGALAVSGGFGSFWIGLKALFVKKVSYGKEDFLMAAESFDLMARCSLGGGFIGLIMGIVMLLVNIMDPEMIGPFLGVAIITVLYGSMLAFLFFYPGKTKLLLLSKK